MNQESEIPQAEVEEQVLNASHACDMPFRCSCCSLAVFIRATKALRLLCPSNTLLGLLGRKISSISSKLKVASLEEEAKIRQGCGKSTPRECKADATAFKSCLLGVQVSFKLSILLYIYIYIFIYIYNYLYMILWQCFCFTAPNVQASVVAQKLSQLLSESSSLEAAFCVDLIRAYSCRVK